MLSSIFNSVILNVTQKNKNKLWNKKKTHKKFYNFNIFCNQYTVIIQKRKIQIDPNILEMNMWTVNIEHHLTTRCWNQFNFLSSECVANFSQQVELITHWWSPCD